MAQPGTDGGKAAPDRERVLSGVAETLLIPLYVRALESRRPDALLVDGRAVALVAAHGAAFARVERIKMDDGDRVALVLRNRELDRLARAFMARNAPGVVVHIGCGLDSRYERVDDGEVDWYDLDLPEVVALRHTLLGDEARGRHHLLATSVLDAGWMETVSRHRPRAVLFLAEGVFMYLSGNEVQLLVRALRERFPGSELVFDAFSPLLVRANNLRLRLSGSPLEVRYRWGLRSGRELEGWGEGIRLLGEWFPLDQPEPRLARYRWLRRIRPLAKVMGIYRYRLGDAPA
jgi:O-methyltransferase involved in polyketide biosynthesis